VRTTKTGPVSCRRPGPVALPRDPHKEAPGTAQSRACETYVKRAPVASHHSDPAPFHTPLDWVCVVTWIVVLAFIFGVLYWIGQAILWTFA
jgi:hypothetical protein